MEEIWKEIPGYDYPYQISNLGDIKFPNNAYKKEHISKGFFNNHGYKQIQLVKDGKPRKLYVHRLVAEIFIPNPNNLSEIDHVNRLKMIIVLKI